MRATLYSKLDAADTSSGGEGGDEFSKCTLIATPLKNASRYELDSDVRSSARETAVATNPFAT